ncbi:hypothetical protein C8R11_103154 [Nitrosomonas aestuarii]|nr:hypothetical protein C8R11_103154 [Nitrosomonas aestuarii]
MKSVIPKTFVKIATLAVLVLFSGCSIVRLGYDHGPQLTWWWLDSYVDFDRTQKPHAKQAIRQWFDWHRIEQLPEYANWLSVVRSRISDPLTSEQVCGWSEKLQDIIAPAFDYAVQLSTPLILSLGETQRRYLEKRYTKSNNKLRRKYLQPDPKDRLSAAIKRTVKRIENIYGVIDEKQRNLIIAGIETSPFNPEFWLFERQRRQQITLSILQQLTKEPVSQEQAAVELRQLVKHTYHSDDPNYRIYQKEMAEHTCDFIARIHNTTTPTQRRHAHDKLKNWETDLRALTGDSLLVDTQLFNALE